MIGLALAALTSVGTAPDGAGTWRFSTPPLPMGVVCGAGPTRELRDRQLTPDTTYAEVVASWGEPGTAGPAGEVSIYSLTCASFVWLSFEPAGQRRLTRALLFNHYGDNPIIIFNRLAVTQNRRCSQLPGGPRQSGRMIARVWGPPDAERGFGIGRWIYFMRGGGVAQVFPRQGGFAVDCRPRMGTD